MSNSIIDMTRGEYRRVYAGFLRGQRINAVTWKAEAWFWRLNVVADGFGVFHADWGCLKSEASPKRSLTPRQAERLTDELVKHGLVALYEVDGETYGQIVGFTDIQPAGKNGKRIKRHPHPPSGLGVNPGESGFIQKNPGESFQSFPEHEHEHEKNNNKNSNTKTNKNGEQDSPEENSSGISSSFSGGRALARTKFVTACLPLLGRRDGMKLPNDSPEFRADETCMNRVFDSVWPEDAARSEGYNRLMGFVDEAARGSVKKPMAWLQDKLKRKDLAA